tara:strand:+ start:16422 stop:17042 length:621 start_codon:yes stop_codon:yes gene_type:complete
MPDSMTEAHFATLIYRAPLLTRGLRAINADLAEECGKIRDFDVPGQRWSKDNYPGGYTSYGSMDRLHRFSSTFDTLRRRIDRHVARYADALEWDVTPDQLAMTDCWINLMPRGCAHSFHVHPQSVISGTYYVQTPRGASPITFEDPRLTKMMAAPRRRAEAVQRSHVRLKPRSGDVLLFESWLRHEVPTSRIDALRISVSFNYHLR